MFSRHLEVMFAGALAFCVAGCHTVDQERSRAASQEFPLGKLAFELPSFRSFEELKTYGKPRDETEKFYVFEKDGAKAVVILETWGSGDRWNGVIVYALDSVRDQWVPYAVWNTGARGVTVAFDKQAGTIDVRSGRGVEIFTVNIFALEARRTRDW